ncbi:hypothetical protein, partial [Priestia flexa]|uniref:hypothetical protein n=1 Tax=Priestia flexa TaxID=86664 RepID=UPI000550388B
FTRRKISPAFSVQRRVLSQPLFYVYFKKPKFALNEWVIGKIKVNFVRERFSACQSSKLTRFLFINDCDEKALSN